MVDTDLDVSKYIDKDSVKLLEEAEAGASSVAAISLGSKITVKEITISDDNAQFWAYVVSESGEAGYHIHYYLVCSLTYRVTAVY